MALLRRVRMVTIVDRAVPPDGRLRVGKSPDTGTGVIAERIQDVDDYEPKPSPRKRVRSMLLPFTVAVARQAQETSPESLKTSATRVLANAKYDGLSGMLWPRCP